MAHRRAHLYRVEKFAKSAFAGLMSGGFAEPRIAIPATIVLGALDRSPDLKHRWEKIA